MSYMILLQLCPLLPPLYSHRSQDMAFAIRTLQNKLVITPVQITWSIFIVSCMDINSTEYKQLKWYKQCVEPFSGLTQTLNHYSFPSGERHNSLPGVILHSNDLVML
jgi:hypothetical protein